VALVIFAAWDPLKCVTGAYLFGAALALSPALQARGIGINQFALDALPYVVTVLVLIFLGRKRLHAAPEGLRKVFEMAPTS
jgi:general nucleoside transport system permease protein